MLALFINFGGSVVIARLLSPEDIGIFAFAMAIAATVGIFTSLNLQSYVVREGVLPLDKIRSMYTLNAAATCTLIIILITVAAFEWRVAGNYRIAMVLAVNTIPALISIFEFVPVSLYQREMNFGILSRIGIVRNLINIIVVVACAASGLGSLSPALGPVAASLFSVCTYQIVRGKDAMLLPTRKGLRPAFTFGLQIMSISGVAQLAQRLSDLGLGQILGVAQLGLYSRASNLAGIVFSNVYGLATNVVFTKMSKELREQGSFHETFCVSMRMITALMWPLIAGIGILSRPLIRILYGSKWEPAAGPLSLLMLYQFIALGFGMNWEVFVLRHETARQTRFEVIRAMVGLPLFLVGCMFSISAAAAGRVAEGIVGYLLYRPHIDRLVGLASGELEKVFRESLLLTLVAVIPSFVVMSLSRWSFDTSPIIIACSVLLGSASWCLGIVLRNHPVYIEFKILRSKLTSLRSSILE